MKNGQGIMPSITFSKENQPKKRRGPTKRPVFLTAIKNAIECDEAGYLEKLIKIGFGLEPGANMGEINTPILCQLMNRTHPPIKPATEKIKFDFPKDSSPVEQARAILVAAADGVIAPDIAKIMLDGLNNVLQIEVNTSLKQRIDELEQLAGVKA